MNTFFTVFTKDCDTARFFRIVSVFCQTFYPDFNLSSTLTGIKSNVLSNKSPIELLSIYYETEEQLKVLKERLEAISTYMCVSVQNLPVVLKRIDKLNINDLLHLHTCYIPVAAPIDVAICNMANKIYYPILYSVTPSSLLSFSKMSVLHVVEEEILSPLNNKYFEYLLNQALNLSQLGTYSTFLCFTHDPYTVNMDKLYKLDYHNIPVYKIVAPSNNPLKAVNTLKDFIKTQNFDIINFYTVFKNTIKLFPYIDSKEHKIIVRINESRDLKIKNLPKLLENSNTYFIFDSIYLYKNFSLLNNVENEKLQYLYNFQPNYTFYERNEENFNNNIGIITDLSRKNEFLLNLIDTKDFNFFIFDTYSNIKINENYIKNYKLLNKKNVKILKNIEIEEYLKQIEVLIELEKNFIPYIYNLARCYNIITLFPESEDNLYYEADILYTYQNYNDLIKKLNIISNNYTNFIKNKYKVLNFEQHCLQVQNIYKKLMNKEYNLKEVTSTKNELLYQIDGLSKFKFLIIVDESSISIIKTILIAYFSEFDEKDNIDLIVIVKPELIDEFVNILNSVVLEFCIDKEPAGILINDNLELLLNEHIYKSVTGLILLKQTNNYDKYYNLAIKNQTPLITDPQNLQKNLREIINDPINAKIKAKKKYWQEFSLSNKY